MKLKKKIKLKTLSRCSCAKMKIFRETELQPVSLNTKLSLIKTRMLSLIKILFNMKNMQL